MTTTPFLSRLANEPHALMFAGQSTPWTSALAELAADPQLDETLHNYARLAHDLLAPVGA